MEAGAFSDALRLPMERMSSQDFHRLQQLSFHTMVRTSAQLADYIVLPRMLGQL